MNAFATLRKAKISHHLTANPLHLHHIMNVLVLHVSSSHLRESPFGFQKPSQPLNVGCAIDLLRDWQIPHTMSSTLSSQHRRAGIGLGTYVMCTLTPYTNDFDKHNIVHLP